jgi:hypothetical protein
MVRSMNRALPLALVLLFAGGCASLQQTSPVPRDPQQDRLSYIDRRSTELIQRGVPKDEALSKASGEWFAQTLNAETAAEARQRAERQALDAKLEKLQRDRRRY